MRPQKSSIPDFNISSVGSVEHLVIIALPYFSTPLFGVSAIYLPLFTLYLGIPLAPIFLANA